MTSLYGIAHGHAAALCVNALLPYMTIHTDDCIDSRGKTYLENTLLQIANAMGSNTIENLCHRFSGIVDRLALSSPNANAEDYETLRDSVNPTRLNNHPIKLDTKVIDWLYHQILR